MIFCATFLFLFLFMLNPFTDFGLSQVLKPQLQVINKILKLQNFPLLFFIKFFIFFALLTPLLATTIFYDAVLLRSRFLLFSFSFFFA